MDPRWGPPRPPRPRWLPFLVLSVVTCLVATGFYVADRVGDQDLATTAQAFLAEDGAVAYSEVQTRAGGRPTARTRFVTESARFTGATAVTAVDFTFGSKLLASLEAETLTGTPFWRTTTTEIGQPASSQQLVRVYRAAGAVELVGGVRSRTRPRLPAGAGRAAGRRGPGPHLVGVGLGRCGHRLPQRVPGRCGGATAACGSPAASPTPRPAASRARPPRWTRSGARRPG